MPLFLPLCWRCIQTMQSMSRAMLCKKLLQFRKEPQWTGIKLIQAKTDYFSFHKYINSVNSASERKWHTVTCGEEAAGRCASCLVTMAAAILCAAAVDDNDSQKRILLQSKHIKCKTAFMFAQPCTKNMMEISISELQTPDSFWTISPAPMWNLPTEWELVSVLFFLLQPLNVDGVELFYC